MSKDRGVKLGWAVRWVGEGVPGRLPGRARRRARAPGRCPRSRGVGAMRWASRASATRGSGGRRTRCGTSCGRRGSRRRTAETWPRRSAARTRGSPPTPRDSAMDRENNRIGQEHGVAHAERIRADAMRPAQSALADEAGRLWDCGSAEPGHRGLHAHRRLRRGHVARDRPPEARRPSSGTRSIRPTCRSPARSPAW